ncbi:MAG: LiaF transmembrane domain-containing protein [Verrucomicrobiia bacterium]
METPQASEKKCSCPCHKIIGLFIALIGLTFLLGALNILSPRIVGVTWPILLLLIGFKIVCGGSCKCCDKA